MNLQTVKPRARQLPDGKWLVIMPHDKGDPERCSYLFTAGDTLDGALRSTHEFLLERAIVSPSYR